MNRTTDAFFAVQWKISGGSYKTKSAFQEASLPHGLQETKITKLHKSKGRTGGNRFCVYQRERPTRGAAKSHNSLKRVSSQRLNLGIITRNYCPQHRRLEFSKSGFAHPHPFQINGNWASSALWRFWKSQLTYIFLQWRGLVLIHSLTVGYFGFLSIGCYTLVTHY